MFLKGEVGECEGMKVEHEISNVLHEVFSLIGANGRGKIITLESYILTAGRRPLVRYNEVTDFTKSC